MQAKIRKRGSNPAASIPKAFAEDTDLEEGTLVGIGMAEGDLMVSPPPAREPTLARLVAGVTEDNLHHEVETGPAMGGESW